MITTHRLRKFWRQGHQWPFPRNGHSRPNIADLLICASYTGPALASAVIFHRADTEGVGLLLSLLAVVVSGTALLFRRRTPMVSLAATAVIMLITFSVPASFAAAATAMALFAVAVYRSARHAVLGLLGASASLLVAAILLPRSMDLAQAVQAIAVLVIATLIGLNVRTRRRYVTALVDHADRLQESLTNALKYARTATAVTVHANFSETTATISVTDDAEPGVVPADQPGRGVAGMRERVALYGGTLDAGARTGGGWSVIAQFRPQKGAPWQR